MHIKKRAKSRQRQRSMAHQRMFVPTDSVMQMEIKTQTLKTWSLLAREIRQRE